MNNSQHWKRKTPSKIEEVLNKNEEIIYKLGNIKFPKNAIWIMPGNDWEYVQIYITDMRIIFEWEKSTWDDNIKTWLGHGDWVGTPSIPVTINLEDIAEFKYSIKTTKKSTKSIDFFLKIPELLIKKRNGKSERFLIPKAKSTLAEKLSRCHQIFSSSNLTKLKKVCADWDPGNLKINSSRKIQSALEKLLSHHQKGHSQG